MLIGKNFRSSYLKVGATNQWLFWKDGHISQLLAPEQFDLEPGPVTFVDRSSCSRATLLLKWYVIEECSVHSKILITQSIGPNSIWAPESAICQYFFFCVFQLILALEPQPQSRSQKLELLPNDSLDQVQTHPNYLPALEFRERGSIPVSYTLIVK